MSSIFETSRQKEESPLSRQPCSYFTEKAVVPRKELPMRPQRIFEPPQHPWPAFLSGDLPLGLGAVGPRESTSPVPTEPGFPVLDCPYEHTNVSSSTSQKPPPTPATLLIFVPFYGKTPRKALLFSALPLNYSIRLLLLPLHLSTKDVHITKSNGRASFLCNRLYSNGCLLAIFLTHFLQVSLA